MAIQVGKALAFTAVGGMVAGLVGCGGADAAPAAAPGAAPAAAPAGAKACCKGHGGCKAADCK